MSDDFAFEPIPGLPEHLPEGEYILWQGGPEWRGVARHVLHFRKQLCFLAIILAILLVGGLISGSALISPVAFLVLTALIVSIAIIGIARWIARTTIYTITNRRLVMRFGLALPMTFNLPFQSIEAAAVRVHGDGSGDIPLTLKGNDRLAWLHLWPHAQPWKLRQPRPMLRNLKDVRKVAGVLTDALATALPHGRKIDDNIVEGISARAQGRPTPRDALATA